MNNEKPRIDRLLNSVATETFVKYFFEFKELNNSELKLLFDKNNETWTDSSKAQKASMGKKIFRVEKEIEALEYVILEKNVSDDVKLRAKEIYKDYNPIGTLSIESTEAKSDDEKYALVKCRIQQGKFRKNLIVHWEGCSVTGCKNPALLIASHIKPYADSNLDEKYDVNNGLLLTPTFDKLFDRVLISFDKNGSIMISKNINQEDLEVLNITGNEQLILTKVTEATLKYLDYHRNIFETQENAE